MAVDGLLNTVVEVEARRSPQDAEVNPHKNAFHTTHARLQSELTAMRDADFKKVP